MLRADVRSIRVVLLPVSLNGRSLTTGSCGGSVGGAGAPALSVNLGAASDAPTSVSRRRRS